MPTKRLVPRKREENNRDNVGQTVRQGLQAVAIRRQALAAQRGGGPAGACGGSCGDPVPCWAG